MTKLVLKCGDIEVEYDGPEEFLKEELPELIKAVAALRGTQSSTNASSDAGANDASDVGKSLSVSSLAQKLAVKNGTELIIAAALSYAKAGTDTFTKKQLRERVRDAKTYYKSSYTSNFDNYIANLVKKGRLNHMSGENYALPATEITALNGRLAAAGA